MNKKVIILTALLGLLSLTSCGKLKEDTKTVSKEKKSYKPAQLFTEIDGRVTAGILFGEDNTMYVAKNDEILKITPDGKKSTFCSFKEMTSDSNYFFISPLIWDMTFDKQGNIIAAAQDRIVKITPDGKATTIIEEDFGGFLGASGIELDSQGNMYVTNGNKIEKYTPDLKKTTFINADSEKYKGFFSLSFSPDGKNLYISDFYTKSLLKYLINTDGSADESSAKVIWTAKDNTGNFGSPLNMVFSDKGNMYVSMDGLGEIMKITPDGKITNIDMGIDTLKNHIVAFGKNGFNEDSLYITTFEGKEIYEFQLGEKEAK